MSQIEELQVRLTRALDRIGQGIEGMPAGGPTHEDYEALRGRAEAAESELAETQESLAAARDQAESDIAAAIEEARTKAAEDLQRALAEAQESAPTPESAEDGETPDTVALQEALEDERMANAQLEERLRVLRDRLTEAESEEARPAPSPDAMAELDETLQRLRAANEELMATNAALREANAQGVGEPDLINKGMEAELEGLRAARAAEAAEASAVMGALTPLLAGAVEEGAQQ